jgi:hypothetical protein
MNAYDAALTGPAPRGTGSWGSLRRGGFLGRGRRGAILPLVPLLLVVAGGLGGCASAGKLGEYEFRERTVGAVALNTPRPEILTSIELDVDFRSPLQAALRIGADVVKEVEAARARPRLAEAARSADVGGLMMDRVLRGVAAELRATPVDDVARADFELEVVVKRYGIDAEAWLAPAHFFVESEVVLRETATGRRIWKGKVTEKEASTPVLLRSFGPDWERTQIANDVMTAAGLGALSTEEMTRMLEALGEFAADRTLRNFRKGLEKSRR